MCVNKCRGFGEGGEQPGKEGGGLEDALRCMWGQRNKGPYDNDMICAESSAVGGNELVDMWCKGPTCPIFFIFF